MVTHSISLSAEGRASFLQLYRQMVNISLVRTLHAAGVFDALMVPSTLEELSIRVDIDGDILRRLLRPLLVTGFVQVDVFGSYTNTAVSEQYIRRGVAADLLNVAALFGLDIFASAGKWLDSDSQDNPFTFHFKRVGWKGHTIAEIISQDQDMLGVFGRGLSAWQSLHPLLGPYDFTKAVIRYQRQPVEAFLVDVGGGDGSFVLEFLHAYPSIAFHDLVVQDIASAIRLARQNAKIPLGIRLEVHDFFQPQPVKGAMIYHLRACLHDWDDGAAVRILANIAAAMTMDSVLLIVENVLADEPDADETASLTDILLLATGGRERRKREFDVILSMAGLLLVDVHRSGEQEWCTLEARLDCQPPPYDNLPIARGQSS